MDIRCPHCGEPWDLDCIHEEVDSRYPGKPWKPNGKYDQGLYDPLYAEVRADFRARGCKALGGRCSSDPDTRTGILARMILDAHGDDLDAAAADMNDML